MFGLIFVYFIFDFSFKNFLKIYGQFSINRTKTIVRERFCSVERRGRGVSIEKVPAVLG